MPGRVCPGLPLGTGPPPRLRLEPRLPAGGPGGRGAATLGGAAGAGGAAAAGPEGAGGGTGAALAAGGPCYGRCNGPGRRPGAQLGRLGADGTGGRLRLGGPAPATSGGTQPGGPAPAGSGAPAHRAGGLHSSAPARARPAGILLRALRVSVAPARRAEHHRTPPLLQHEQVHVQHAIRSTCYWWRPWAWCSGSTA